LGEILKSKEKKVKLLVLLYRGFGAQGYFYDGEETKDIININFRWGLVSMGGEHFRACGRGGHEHQDSHLRVVVEGVSQISF
jgi:hypothetical protein